jgi:precorrin-2 dehydrogenase / sirohydrochlorin ferrochelatase
VIDADLYLACLVLRGRRCLVVGGGRIAFEKIQGLLVCEADVVVVAPDAEPQVRALAESGAVKWLQREYEAGDLDGCLLVVAATSDTAVNEWVYKDAEERSMLVNVVDVPDLCNFILPAIVREGPLAVAISTAGASPALAVRMRDEVARSFGPAYTELAVMLDEVRGWAKTTLPTYDDRKEFFDALVNGDPDPIELLRAGRRAEVEEMIAAARARAEQRFAR